MRVISFAKTFAACVAMIALPAAADASRWWHVMEQGSYPGRIEQFVDQDSIRDTAAGHKLVATMMVTEQPIGQAVTAMQGLYEVDCSKGRSRSLVRLGIDRDGIKVRQLDRQPLPWGRNHPGSFAAIVQAAVCVGKFPRQAFYIEGLDPQVVSRAYFAADASE
jgi:hypothetical protein